jgi:hypothetical protein
MAPIRGYFFTDPRTDVVSTTVFSIILQMEFVECLAAGQLDVNETLG